MALRSLRISQAQRWECAVSDENTPNDAQLQEFLDTRKQELEIRQLEIEAGREQMGYDHEVNLRNADNAQDLVRIQLESDKIRNANENKRLIIFCTTGVLVCVILLVLFYLLINSENAQLVENIMSMLVGAIVGGLGGYGAGKSSSTTVLEEIDDTLD